MCAAWIDHFHRQYRISSIFLLDKELPNNATRNSWKDSGKIFLRISQSRDKKYLLFSITMPYKGTSYFYDPLTYLIRSYPGFADGTYVYQIRHYCSASDYLYATAICQKNIQRCFLFFSVSGGSFPIFCVTLKVFSVTKRKKYRIWLVSSFQNTNVRGVRHKNAGKWRSLCIVVTIITIVLYTLSSLVLDLLRNN